MLPAVSQVADIVQNTRDCAATLAKGTKPLSAILLKKHRLQSVADEPDFATPLAVNLDFSRLTENKTISNKCLGTVSLEYMEGCAKALLEANSFFLWLMSGLLSQLKRGRVQAIGSDSVDSAISSLSCLLSNQMQTASALSNFLVSKRRESYLCHASLLRRA